MVDAKSVCNRFRLFFDIIGKIAVNIFVKTKKFIKELENMKKLISLMLAMVLCLTPVLVSCGETNTPTPTPPDPGIDDPGTGGSRTPIFMQGYGDEEQHKEFNSMVEGFNNSEYARQYGLILRLDWLGQTTYEQGIENGSTVSSDNRVDIMFVNDRKFKLWATNGYMDDLSAYTSTSEYREEKLGNIRIPESRDEDIFAGWMPKFNAKQNLDFFKPLQTEKPAPTLEDDVNELRLALKHKRWQEKLNETMANLDLSKYKG